VGTGAGRQTTERPALAAAGQSLLHRAVPKRHHRRFRTSQHRSIQVSLGDRAAVVPAERSGHSEPDAVRRSREHDHVRLGGYPAPFQELLGLRVEEFAPYAESQTNEVLTIDDQRFACTEWSDVIQLHGAESIATYQHDYYANLPAVTCHSFGQGTGYYVGTQLDDAGWSWLIDRVSAEAKVTVSPAKPIGVELIRRADEAHAWLFALNYSDQSVEVALDRSGRDLISGKSVDRSIALGPAGVAIVQSALS
jgi:beta-galactosidase